MKIVLCDDDIKFLEELKKRVKKICEELGENSTVIIAFASGEEFYEYYGNSKNIDIIILDILMKDINGIEVAKKIRKVDNKMQIFFLTSIKNYVFEGYNLTAVNYLLKPIKESILKYELNKAINNVHNYFNKYFVEKNDKGVFKVYIEDIMYIETYLRNTQIHTKKEIILSYKSMKKHMDRVVNEDFYRIHESYIINLTYISKVKGNEIILLDEEVLPISKNRKKSFMERLAIFYGKII